MSELPETPQSREEEWLAVIAGMVGIEPGAPISRVEKWLAYIAENGGGGGGGGTTNYNQLSNKPSINNVTMSGNKSASDLGLYPAKPNGIPKADLASEVQSSLDKADSALQEHQSLDGYATQTWVNEQGFLKNHQDISGKLDSSNVAHETWTFTLDDDTEVTKEVVLWTGA